jgi:2-oxoisovalerate dehydrogenase E1 component
VRELSYLEATREALAEELEADANLFVIGEDVGAHGGIFGTTTHLQSRFGAQRIREAQALERGVLGFCIGAALAGARPVIDLTFSDHLLFALGDLAQQVAVLPQLSRGRTPLPLVLRVSIGLGFSTGPFHSGNYHSYFVHLPGIRVVAPSHPADGKGLLKAAIRSQDPVIFLEHKGLMEQRGMVIDRETLPSLDRARLVQTGNDLTLLAYGLMAQRIEEAAELLKEEAITTDVIDLRTLAPVDWRPIEESVAKTGRVLIVDDAYAPCSISAEIAAHLASSNLDDLDAPILRLHGPHAPVPYGPAAERSSVPSVEDIVAAAHELLEH